MLNSLNIPEILVEILGILANLDIPNFDFCKLCETHDIFNFCIGVLSNTTRRTDYEDDVAADDDILLEVLILLGTMSHDENIHTMIIKTPILKLLVDIMSSREEDDEIILQCCYCIHQFLLNDDMMKILVAKTPLVGFLIDLLYDRNVELRKSCDACLSIISVCFI
jgi:hypothetical protein